MTNEQLEAFLSDRELLDLVEAVKVSDDILDVIKLSEVQHSEMLAWCLNPSEGHAQGDAVLKDFLIAAGRVAGRCTYHTGKFYKHWTPSRLHRTSFGSAFITREFHIALPESVLSKTVGRRKGFLDLFVVDPINRLIIAIENKAGAKLGAEQLEFYSEQVRVQVAARPAFRDFSFAFVVLDRNLGDYDEEHLRSLGNRWALLDYSWLEGAAKRAGQHVARNNQAAQLLMAYCQHLTGWEKESQKRTSDLAAQLAIRYRPVVEELRALQKSSIKDWKPKTIDQDGLDIFFHQNKTLCTELIQASGIPGLVGILKRTLAGRAEVEKNGPTRATFATKVMLKYQKIGQDWWPMYVHIRRRDQGESDAPFRYDLRFIMRNDAFSTEKDANAVRALLSDQVKGIATFPEANHRRIVLATQLTGDQCIRQCTEWADKLDQRLSTLK